MHLWQERTDLLMGSEALERLRQAHVLVVGVGGVGAYAAEMLCRAGVGTLTLVDADTVQESNINRQLIALTSTIGRAKTEVLAERLKLINPDVTLHLVPEYINDDNIATLFVDSYSYVVDAIDTLAPKVSLIKAVMERGLPLVSSMGAGAKFDPSKITVADISKSCYCPLAHQLRKRLGRMGIRKGFSAVFSTEIPIETAMKACEERNKKTIVGTVSYLPAMFGCTCASVVIRNLIA